MRIGWFAVIGASLQAPSSPPETVVIIDADVPAVAAQSAARLRHEPVHPVAGPHEEHADAPAVPANDDAAGLSDDACPSFLHGAVACRFRVR